MPPRRLGTLSWESSKAMVALAGVRQLKQATVAVTTADTTYTVTEKAAHRVIIVHGVAAYGDIRFAYNAAATTTSIPILGSTYFVVDAIKGDVLHFIGVPATTNVNIMEVE